MMDYVIYTFGGQDLLVHIFNGLARIFKSNSNYFTPVGAFVMTIGGVWAAVQAIFNNNIGFFAKRWFFPSLLAFTLLFTPRATVWIHDDVANNAPIKVDNVPFIIAFFSSISSRISYTLSEMIENQLLPADNIRSNRAGLMFGAKIIGKIKDVTIQDPVLLDNTKNFCKQCFTKPWVMGNILGKRREALEANNIIEFIKNNIPNNFGIYYKNQFSFIEGFKTCKEAIPLIESGLNQELKSLKTLQNFGATLGLRSKQDSIIAARLNAITRDTLDYFERETNNVHTWMKQAMVLNANRESIDDWRESFGHQRVYPHLVQMNATRGLFQQSLGYIISGDIAAETLPLMQSILFSIIICAIFIVFPFAMLPDGMIFLITWIKMLLWVNSWPVFFAILNCIGMFVLSLRSSGIGKDIGLSILSQGGYAEMILNTYAIVQYFAMLVPFVSWQILSQGGRGIVHLADKLSSLSTGAALGAAAVDRNISLDNISVGTRQIAQQNIGPSLNEGSRVSMGNITTIQGPYGDITAQESLTQGSSNFSIMDGYNHSLQQGIQESIGVQESISNRLGESYTKGTSHAFEYSEHVSNGLATAEGWTTQDQINLTNAREKALNIAESYGERFSKSTGTTSGITASIGFGLNKTGASLTVGTDARNSEDLNQDFQSALTTSERNSLNKYLSFAQEGRFSSNQDHVQRLGENIRNNFDEQQQLTKDLAIAKSVTENWHEAFNQSQNKGTNLQANLTDVIHKKIMKEMGKDSVEAMNWMNANPQAIKGFLNQIAKEKYNISESMIAPTSFKEISNQVKNQSYQIPDKASFKDNALENIAHKAQEQALNRGLDSNQIKKELLNAKNKIPNEKQPILAKEHDFNEDIQAQQQKLKEKFDNASNSTPIRSTSQIVNNTAESFKDTLECIGKNVVQIDEINKEMAASLITKKDD